MTRRGKPGIITVGNRHEWPSSEWGSKDWADHEAAEQLHKPMNVGPVIPPPAYELPPNFGGLYGKPKREVSPVDFLLKKLLGSGVGDGGSTAR